MAGEGDYGSGGVAMIRQLRGKGKERALLVGRWLPAGWTHVVVSVAAASEDVVVLRVRNIRTDD
ncbi:hypothetical protein LCGC14_1931610 [marine sediment metagenome]|uniref:Uncharacterized protein n=1 Tax=marine sediment metagenome TaxID=412755 RepID=A0A0F9FMX1_9ZZZZ